MKNPKNFILTYNKSKRIQYLKKPKEKKNRKLEMGNR